MTKEQRRQAKRAKAAARRKEYERKRNEMRNRPGAVVNEHSTTMTKRDRAARAVAEGRHAHRTRR